MDPRWVQHLPVPVPLAPSAWWGRWPQDASPLAVGVAVAAAFRGRVERLTLVIEGDVERARAGLLERLAAAGVPERALPALELVRGRRGTPRRHISRLAEQLTAVEDVEPAAADEADVWEAAEAAPQAGPVMVVAETLDGAEALADHVPLVVVAQDDAVRTRARALGSYHPVRAIARPPSAAQLPPAALVALDGRRPQDLRLARAPGVAHVAIAHADHLSDLALAGFGLVTVDRARGCVLAAPADRAAVAA